MLVLILKIATKLNCKRLVFYVLSFLYRGNGYRVFSNRRKAELYMEGLSPDQGHSSISHNEIVEEPQYDLQIVVPVYNTEKYLERCIDSILSQDTHYSYHIFIVNDGSTDHSRAILEKYIQNASVTIIDQKNRGLSGARNRALRRIEANYIMFVDSDDILLDDCVEKLLDEAYLGDFELVEGGYQWFDDHGILNVYNHKIVEPLSIANLHGQPWAKLYRASLFQNISFPEGYWFEDTVNLMVLYRKISRFTIIPQVIYGYRNNAESITNVSKRQYKTIDTYWVTKRLMEDTMTLNLPMNEEFFELFLKQLIISGKRIYALNDLKLLAAYVVASKGLLEEYFKECMVSSTSYGRMMQSILSHCDYKRMRLAIMFMWDEF